MSATIKPCACPKCAAIFNVASSSCGPYGGVGKHCPCCGNYIAVAQLVTAHKAAQIALNELPPNCSDHPDAPHGFNRDASHSADRYVCDCEGWTSPQLE